jgi:glycosyltransferase involved in cell wall biosynthesis
MTSENIDESSMHECPKISVITPSFNCAQYIRHCIESVSEQGYPNLEHIVVDGASTDETVEILKEYPHIRWISEPDRGEGEALNKALALASGEIISWLNADDSYAKGCLAKVVHAFRTGDSKYLVYGNVTHVDEGGRPIRLHRCIPNIQLKHLVCWWLSNSLLNQRAVFYSREVFEKLGPLNDKLHFSIDFEHWLRLRVHYPFHHIDDVLSYATERSDCKSQGTVGDQIKSHWKVLMPFHQHLTAGERLEFWRDYFLYICQNNAASFPKPPENADSVVALALLVAESGDEEGAARYLVSVAGGEQEAGKILDHYLDGVESLSSQVASAIQTLRNTLTKEIVGSVRDPSMRPSKSRPQHAGVLHFVYSGNPADDSCRGAPGTITNRLFRFLEGQFKVRYADWASTEPLAIGRDDILLGHPNYEPDSFVQRAFRDTECKAKFLIFPFHHALPEINRPFDTLVRKCARLFSITGEYWYDTISRSEFAHWKEKMIRVDMAIDAAHFPFLKERFSPKGKRVLFYLGSDRPEKGVSHLASLVRLAGCRLLYAGSLGPCGELFKGLDFKYLGPISLTREVLQWLAQQCDFFVNTSVSDANPTTILEMSAIGLPVLCTPQSGYVRPDLVYTLRLDDDRYNVALVNRLQQTEETSLIERSQAIRAVVERDYTWDRFCQTVLSGMEPHL